MPSVRAISDQTRFIDGKLTYRRLIAARTEGSRATLSVPRSSVVAAHLLHGIEDTPIRECPLKPLPGSNIVRTHLATDVLRLAQRQCDDRQCRIRRARGAEQASVRHEQILDVVRLPPGVGHAIRGLRAHARGSPGAGCGGVGAPATAVSR